MKRRHFIQSGIAGIGTLALSSQTWALQYYPKTSNKKWAILYSTWCGSSRDAAVWISEGMGGIADVFDVRENPDLSDFDHLVIGGSIRMGATSKDLQDYLMKNRDVLKPKIRGLFAVCGNMRQPVGPAQTKKFIDDHLMKRCGVGKVPSKVFLGRVTKSLMEPDTANMMSRMEDYDNLKRPECMAFGKEVLENVVSTETKK